MPKRKNKKVGNFGEKYAQAYLKDKGYEILSVNESSKYAEIDIIAIDRDTLVFVEVKTRSSTKFGSPTSAVGKRKIAQIKKGAHYFIKTHKSLPKKTRIEIVAIITEKSAIKSIKLYKYEG